MGEEGKKVRKKRERVVKKPYEGSEKEGLTPERVKEVVKEVKVSNKKADELKKAWNKLGLSVAFPAVGRRIDNLLGQIGDLQKRMEETEKNYILLKTRLELLDKWRYFHGENVATVSNIITEVLAKVTAVKEKEAE